MRTEKSAVKSAVLIIIGILALLCTFIFSNAVKLGMKSGIEVCLCLLIPSLFLPLVICSFIQQTGGLRLLGKMLSHIAARFFRTSGSALAAFLLCMLSGYPSGALMLRRLYDSGTIDKAQAQRMSCSAVCAGPAFILLGVGEGMLNSRISGVILLISHISAALILLIADGAIHRNESVDETNALPKQIGVMSSAVNSVVGAARSMAMICALTLIFSAVNAVADNFGTPFAIISVTLCEPTNACLYYAGGNNLSVLAAILGFSGLSIIAQVCFALGDICNFPKLVLYRIINAALSYIICTAVLKLFPQARTASFIGGANACLRVSSATPMLSFLLIICIILLLCSVHQKKIRPISDFFSS